MSTILTSSLLDYHMATGNSATWEKYTTDRSHNNFWKT